MRSPLASVVWLVVCVVPSPVFPWVRLVCPPVPPVPPCSPGVPCVGSGVLCVPLFPRVCGSAFGEGCVVGSPQPPTGVGCALLFRLLLLTRVP